MKKTLITMITFLLISATSFAQQPNRQGRPITPEERTKRQTEQMAEDLNLNEEQIQKVKTLNEKYGEKRAEFIKKTQKETREQVREKADSLRKAKYAELKEILTEEQFTKHQKLQEERMQRFRQMRENRPGNGNASERRGRPRGNRQ
ncbi:MAG: DUF4890 domain-containing protein [Prolixibacteraceae bacterium]|nr:DUF4890 domain-containing protein [Prolixibacteraceae bacterium]